MKILDLFSHPKFAVESPSARRQYIAKSDSDVRNLIRALRYEIQLQDKFSDLELL
jgi:hypothetical protein